MENPCYIFIGNIRSTAYDGFYDAWMQAKRIKQDFPQADVRVWYQPDPTKSRACWDVIESVHYHWVAPAGKRPEWQSMETVLRAKARRDKTLF